MYDGNETHRLAGKVFTVAAGKGGVGKSTDAYELAFNLDAVLVDLEWDKGSATRRWGYLEERRQRAPMLDAIERGRVPRVLDGGSFRPDLIPGHSDLVANQPDPHAMAEMLRWWAAELKRPIVVDTHPGGSDSTKAAMAAAHLNVLPAVLKTAELHALEGWVNEHAGYPMLIQPTMVPRVPPAPELRRLASIAQGLPVGPMINHYTWIGSWKRRMAISSQDPCPARHEAAKLQYMAMTQAVIQHV